MEITHLTCGPANFMRSRPQGMRPEAIVLHRTGATAEQIRVRFGDSTTALSTHYVITKVGAVLNYVGEQDTAFHAGLVVNPTWKALKPKVNPNFYTIGIELEGASDDPIPEEQSEACAVLVAEVAGRWHFAIDSEHIVLHSEIRASRSCPGAAFDRSAFIQRALLAASSATAVFSAPAEIEILATTNVREGAPSSAVRIVSVLSAGAKLRVSGFTLGGETINGNSAWFQNEEGDFLWAGSSSIPEPRPEHAAGNALGSSISKASVVPSAIVVPVAPTGSCPIGIREIDQFLADRTCAPLELGKSGRDTVGVIQDLLTGHGFSKLPSLLSPSYGICNDTTRDSLCTFQRSCGLTPDAFLTATTLKQLIGLPQPDPRATHAHFSLVLGFPFARMSRLLAITAQMEGVGRFAALNQNTDFAGLSFGLIQWAQRPGRLLDIVLAFCEANGQEFLRIFGEGDAAVANGLLSHLRKPGGGVLEKTGVTTDPQFDLVASPWVERFKAAALQVEFQRVQVETAEQAFDKSLARLRQYDTANLISSERAVAFMLDVANQFGDGSTQRPAGAPDRGLAGLYRKVFRPGMTEPDLLQAIADASVAAMPPRFQAGVRSRRTLFLTTPLLSGSEVFQSTPIQTAATA